MTERRRVGLILLVGGIPAVVILSVTAVLWLPSAPPTNTDVPVIVDGRPAAVIVTPDKPTRVVQYAAQELVAHLEKASGARLPVVTESAIPTTPRGRIYLGECAATRKAGIAVGSLPPEGFVVRTVGGALFIAGDDSGGEALDPDTRAGTLFGVYEWVDRALGVRWLWPGELGTVVPKARTVVAHPVDWKDAPRFFQRRVRPGLKFDFSHPALGFTAKAFEEYAQQQTIFQRRHRMGRSEKMSYGHAFTDWWEKYGTEHPEWFQLVNGKRGPAKRGARYSMCVSNPGLHRQIVELWKARGGAKVPDRPSFINAVENDILGLCECEACKAWDGPEPADYRQFLSPKSKMWGARFVSDRYARFWLAVQQLAAKENPNAVVIGYAYFNYFAAPTSGVKLNPNILIGFCPSGSMFPRSAGYHQWLLDQWKGWRAAGARLFARTNSFLDGYCMPWIFAHQFADEFQQMVRNGLVATDYDSLTGHWATQGPNLYLVHRLQVRPDANPDDLLAEYYSAFGAAGPLVKSYFDYWEKRTLEVREQVERVFEEKGVSRWRSFAKGAHLAFPPECFAPAEAILKQAAEAAAGDREASARVAFLRTGLEHAKRCARAASLLSTANPQAAQTPAAKKALEELLAFRRAHEREWISNFNHCAWQEDFGWQLGAETKQEPELYP